MTLSIDHFYLLVGLLLAAVAIMNLVDRSNPRRVTTALPLERGKEGTVLDELPAATVVTESVHRRLD